MATLLLLLKLLLLPRVQLDSSCVAFVRLRLLASAAPLPFGTHQTLNHLRSTLLLPEVQFAHAPPNNAFPPALRVQSNASKLFVAAQRAARQLGSCACNCGLVGRLIDPRRTWSVLRWYRRHVVWHTRRGRSVVLLLCLGRGAKLGPHCRHSRQHALQHRANLWSAALVATLANTCAPTPADTRSRPRPRPCLRLDLCRSGSCPCWRSC